MAELGVHRASVTPLAVIRGDTASLTIAVVDDQAAAVDISTGITLRFTARLSTVAIATVLAKTTEGETPGITILDDGETPELKGLASIALTPDDWTAYAFGLRALVWDVEEELSVDDATVVRTIGGTPLGDAPLIVTLDVTRVDEPPS